MFDEVIAVCPGRAVEDNRIVSRRNENAKDKNFGDWRSICSHDDLLSQPIEAEQIEVLKSVDGVSGDHNGGLYFIAGDNIVIIPNPADHNVTFSSAGRWFYIGVG